MKKEYPNYLHKMHLAEKKLNTEDRRTLEEYLNFCRLTAGEDKVQQRRRYVIQFRDIAEVPYDRFDRKTVEGIYLLIKNSDREDVGKNEAIKNLKRLVNWKFKDMNLTRNLKVINIRKGRNTKKINPSTLITDKEVEALIRACNSLKEKAMITLFVECGLRPQELLGLKWDDIKIDGDVGQLRVYSNKIKETRILPFKTCVIHLLRWKDEYQFPNRRAGDLVFPNPTDRNKKLFRTYLSDLFRRLCKRAGIRHIFPYLARHTRITQLKKELPIAVCSAYAGHSEKTSATYTHLTEDDVREIVLERIYDIKEPTPKESRKFEKEIKQIRHEIMEYQERLAELEQEEAKRKEGDEIINALTNDPDSLKPIAKAMAKLGLVDKLLKI
jgi:integrase